VPLVGLVDHGVQRAPAVTRVARDEVQVDVGHGLARYLAVVEAHGHGLGARALLQFGQEFVQGSKQVLGLLSWHVLEQLVVGLGHDEGVALAQRERVQKS